MANIRDVAKHSGFSCSTVSRAINNTGYVDENTRRIIMQTIEELDYKPSYTAQALSRKSSKTIGVIVSEIKNPFFSDLIDVIYERAQEAGYRVIISISSNMPEKECAAIDFMQRIYIDGIIIAPCGKNDAFLTTVNTPLVVVDRPVEQLPSVASDNYAGGRMVGEEFNRCNVKSVLCILGPSHFKTSFLRGKGLVDMLLAKGIPYTVLESNDEMSFSSEDLANHLRTGLYDGLFAWNGTIGANALKCMNTLGLRMPDDIQFITTDGSMLSDLLMVSPTMLIQDIKHLGESAVDMLVDIVQNKPLEQKHVLHPMYLRKQDTTQHGERRKKCEDGI